MIQYLCLLQTVQDICACCQCMIVHNILCLISMIRIVSVWCIHDTQYLCLDHVTDFMCCESHPIKFSHYLISGEVETLVYLSQSRHEISDYDRPMSRLHAKFSRDKSISVTTMQ